MINYLYRSAKKLVLRQDQDYMTDMLQFSGAIAPSAEYIKLIKGDFMHTCQAELCKTHSMLSYPLISLFQKESCAPFARRDEGW